MLSIVPKYRQRAGILALHFGTAFPTARFVTDYERFMHKAWHKFCGPQNALTKLE
jgi:hypothetical protein